jgi:hypothetical protein
MNELEYVDWGLISYAEAYEKQKVLFEAAVERKRLANRRKTP